ncbi:periplasmic heavy metal sensor [Alkalitalea saponilacus]|uniref:Heavy-metal resistance n=1 Tax=Alkalitalea saponilacus TaxID=889453 RepID=A0A1T5EFS7_9BACT|nr:periplasmic heavy metal sensor [Alkalitalea saponilacus]ASB48997.1 hypothetical protein CDL62_07530 [Alkalitalea saponilacus]SKB82761.1 Heavy-metal resistance [Alkalitalea saponilacus]
MRSKYLIYALVLILAFLSGWVGFRFIKGESPEPVVSELAFDSIPGRGFFGIARILEFDDVQREKFREMEIRYRTDLRDLMISMNEFESLIVEEFSKSAPDTSRLSELALQVGKIQGEIKQLSIDHFLSIRDICDERQTEKLAVLFSNMHERPGFRRGREGQGRGEGRNRFGRRGN